MAQKDQHLDAIRQQYPPILTTNQVAELLGLNVRTVMVMANDGRLPASRLPGSRKYHFILEDVLSTLFDHRVGQASRAAPGKATPAKLTPAKAASAGKTAPAKAAATKGAVPAPARKAAAKPAAAKAAIPARKAAPAKKVSPTAKAAPAKKAPAKAAPAARAKRSSR